MIIVDFKKTNTEFIKQLINNNDYFLIKNFRISKNTYKDDFLNFIKKIGIPTEHNKGCNDFVWDIKKRITNSSVISFSEHSEEAGFHTDSQYDKIPENFFALLCLKQSKYADGVNYLVSLSQLKNETKTQGFSLIPYYENIFPFITPSIFSKNRKYTNCYSILSNEKPQIRYRYDTLSHGANLFLSNNIKVKEKIDKFNDFICSDFILKKCEKLLLSKGDLLIVNNHKVLHARTKFTDCRRHLLRIRFNEKI